MIVSGGRARHNSGGTASAYYRNDAIPPSADYNVKGKFFFDAQSGTPSVGIMGRMGTGNVTGYQARFLGGTGLQLVRFVGGTATVLIASPYTLVAGTEATIELRMVADQISVYLNDVLTIGPVADTGVTAAGVPGIRAINSTTQVQISEMSADDGAAAGGVNTQIRPDPAALVVTGYAPTISRTESQVVSPTPAALTITGFAPFVEVVAAADPNSVAITLPSPSPMITLTGFAPSIVRGTSKSVSPARAAVTITGYPPSINQFSGVTPEYSVATIMRATTTNRTAAIGPADTNRTVSFP